MGPSTKSQPSSFSFFFLTHWMKRYAWTSSYVSQFVFMRSCNDHCMSASKPITIYLEYGPTHATTHDQLIKTWLESYLTGRTSNSSVAHSKFVKGLGTNQCFIIKEMKGLGKFEISFRTTDQTSTLRKSKISAL